MKLINKVLAMLLFLFLSVNLVACDRNSQKDNLTEIELAILDLDISHVPLLIAISNGFFEEEGLDIKIRNYPNEQLILDEVKSGNVPVALISADSVISSNSKDNSVLFFASYTHKNASFLIQREQEKKLDFNNLEGTSILFSGINNTNIINFNYLCNKNDDNINKEITKISNIDSSNIETAFKSGTGDLALVSALSAYNLDSTSQGKIICSIGEEVGQSLSNVFVSNEDYINNNGNIIQKFTNAIYKSQLFMETHSLEEISAITISHFDSLNKETLFNCIKKYKNLNLWNASPKIRQDDFNKMIEIASSTLSSLDKDAPKFEDIIDNSFAENAINKIKN